MSPTSEFAAAALLPAGLVDVLPPRAAFEAATAETLLAAFARYGYERVKPPLLEFEDTLLAGPAAALAGETFRLMDPLSQRMLALRPDITMQAARIAATRLAFRPRPLRLSYSGQVVRVRGSQTRPERQLGQVGAEVVGAVAAAADVEIVVMAADALAAAGVRDLTVDLGLPTLIPRLLEAEAEAGRPVDPGVASRLRIALDRKDATAVAGFADRIGAETSRALVSLIAGAGPAESAFEALMAAPLPASAAAERDALAQVYEGLRAAAPAATLTIDAVEYRGFEYHTGVTFALFAPGVAGELGRGGRYRTEAGEAATGVTLFLDAVLSASAPPPPPPRLLLPAGAPADLAARLRRDGWIAVAQLGDEPDVFAEARRLGCSHVLIDGAPRLVAAAPDA